MEKLALPQAILKHVKDMTYEINEIGQSRAQIYHFSKRDREYFLKIEKSNAEFQHEQEMMKWLYKKLPVPKVVAQCEEGDFDYLLMTKMFGTMACADDYLKKPEELVRILAEGIKALQSVKVWRCPYTCTIENKLALAKIRIEKGEIDDWEESVRFKTPQELYEYLVKNQPKEEFVFSHGDYCLPNLFFDHGKVTGYIDLGRSGVADKWQDIALCVRSLTFNLKSNSYNKLLFECLGIEPNEEKIEYYILLDELF